LQKELADVTGAGFSMTAMGEVLPRYENFVRINKDVKDEWGIPALHIQHRYTDNEREMVKDAMHVAEELSHGAGFQILAKHSKWSHPREHPRAGYLPHGRRPEDFRAQSVQPEP